VKLDGIYRLRHYTTGLFLSAKKQKRTHTSSDTSPRYKLDLEYEETKNSMIKFKQVNFSGNDDDFITQKVITKGVFLMIQFVA